MFLKEKNGVEVFKINKKKINKLPSLTQPSAPLDGVARRVSRAERRTNHTAGSGLARR